MTSRNIELLIASLIIVVTLFLMVADNLSVIHFGYFVGPLRANHWFVLLGTFYVAITVPLIAKLKQKYSSKFFTLFRLHVFGNLLAFVLISLHFAGQVSRPAAFYPDLGTGLTLYIIMMFLVATGFTHRFNLIPKIKSQTRKYVHVGLSFSFYIVIIIHTLHGFGFL